MLKIHYSAEEVESHAAEVLEKLLREIPKIKPKSIQIGSKARDAGIDIMMHAEVSGEPHLLVCEVKQSGQPRYARDAVMSLRHYISERGKPAFGPICVKNFVAESNILGGRTEEQWQLDAFGQVDEWMRALGLRA